MAYLIAFLLLLGGYGGEAFLLALAACAFDAIAKA